MVKNSVTEKTVTFNGNTLSGAKLKHNVHASSINSL